MSCLPPSLISNPIVVSFLRKDDTARFLAANRANLENDIVRLTKEIEKCIETIKKCNGTIQECVEYVVWNQNQQTVWMDREDSWSSLLMKKSDSEMKTNHSSMDQANLAIAQATESLASHNVAIVTARQQLSALEPAQKHQSSAINKTLFIAAVALGALVTQYC